LSIDDPIIETYKAITISEATDLNLKVSYLVSDQFSFFIKANNILDNQYQVYLYYPVRGFQALAGLTWSF
jgi:outer membrane cobalamin receptor